MNLFENIPSDLPQEIVATLAESEGARIERIVSDGHASPNGFWYDQDENEWVLLVAGRAELLLETAEGVQRVELAPGDHLLIPARQRHRVESTSSTEKTIWLAVHFQSPALLENTETHI